MKDVLGALLSLLCIIHCMLPPVLLFVGIGSLGAHLLESEWVHWLLLLPISALAAWSLPTGFIVHRRYLPLTIGVVGIVLMVASLFVGHEYEYFAVVVAGLFLIGAHLSNRKLLQLNSQSLA